MSTANLWAVAYDEMARAEQVRDEIIRLGWEEHYLNLFDTAIVVRHPDGSFTFDRKPINAVESLLGSGAVGFLAGLVLGAPLTGTFIGALVGGAGSAVAAEVRIGEDFVREVEALLKPGTSALFVLDGDGDLDVILHDIKGLGGSVLRTNVDLERAKLIQSALAATATATMKPTDQ